MELNQSTLRGILAQILSVDESFVIPKQGNWYNPQESENKPATWCAYRIKSNRPRTAPFYEEVGGKQTCLVYKIAEIELQFVGKQSEEIAQSVSMWPMRSDVQKYFKSVQGAIMYDDMTAISSFFSQEGGNTVTAWNVTFKVLWVSQMPANQNIIKTIDIGGHTYVK